MKTKYIVLLFILSLFAAPMSAQTAAKAKALYEAGQYEEAKTALKKLLKASPSNGNYNLWYGVSCLETGEPLEALKPLQTAVKRRVKSGKLHLARTYDALYRYEEAIETFEEYIEELEKLKRSTDEAEELLSKTRANQRMLKGVEKVCVVDSFVVPKADFLGAYRLSAESGRLSRGKQGTIYENELGNRLYYSEYLPQDSTTSILSSNKLLDNWSAGKPLPDNINAGRNTGYPYALSDGITLYYASDGEESLGGMDIFVTRYNTNTDSYLTPENVGMPFNSPDNDYLYVVDEFNNLGWFATDRYQPEDTVCIYVFVPNPSKQVYNYEAMDRTLLVRLAQLRSISDTWTEENAEALQAARERLKKALSSSAPASDKQKEKAGTGFVINDERTAYGANDFHSPEARQAYITYSERQKEFAQLSLRLEAMRDAYARSDAQGKQAQAPQILALEKQVEALRAELEKQAKEIRRLEILK